MPNKSRFSFSSGDSATSKLRMSQNNENVGNNESSNNSGGGGGGGGGGGESNADYENKEINYSTHILECLIKFLPNNPNFCNSYKQIEEEEYFKNCKISLLYYSINNNINPLIENIVFFLERQLSNYDEFAINYLPTELVLNENTTTNTTASLPYRTSKKTTQYPIKSMGIANYILIFMRLLTDICEVNYAYFENPFFTKFSYKEKKSHFDNLSHIFFNKDPKKFKVLIFGKIQNQIFEHLNNQDTNKTSRHSPKTLNPVLFKRILKVIIPLKSTSKLENCINKIIKNDKLLLPIVKDELLNGTLTQAANQIATSKNTNNNASNDNNKGGSNTYDDEHWDKIHGMKGLRDELDSNIEYLFYYLSNSNPKDYFAFLEKTLLKQAQLENIHPGNSKIVGNNYVSWYASSNNTSININININTSTTAANNNSSNNNNVNNNTGSGNGGNDSAFDYKTEDTKNNNLSSNGGENNTSSRVLPITLNIYNSELLYATEYLSYVSFKHISDLINFIKLITKLFGLIKRTIFKKCCALAFAHCLELWIVSKPIDYKKFTHNKSTAAERTMLKKEASQLFNQIYSSFNPTSLISNVYGNGSTVKTQESPMFKLGVSSESVTAPSPSASLFSSVPASSTMFPSGTSKSSSPILNSNKTDNIMSAAPRSIKNLKLNTSTTPSSTTPSTSSMLKTRSSGSFSFGASALQSMAASAFHRSSSNANTIYDEASDGEDEDEIAIGEEEEELDDSDLGDYVGEDNDHDAEEENDDDEEEENHSIHNGADAEEENNEYFNKHKYEGKEGYDYATSGFRNIDAERKHSKNLVDFISKFLSTDEPAIITSIISPYTNGYCTLDDEIIDFGDLAIIKSLISLSMINVEVFENFLNKTTFKKILNENDILQEQYSDTNTQKLQQQQQQQQQQPAPLFSNESRPSSATSWATSSSEFSKSPSPSVFNVAGDDGEIPHPDRSISHSASNVPLSRTFSPGPVNDAYSSTPSSPYSYTNVQTPIPIKTSVMSSHKLQKNLKKMTTGLFLSSYTSSKEVKFWNQMIKCLTLSNTSSHQISDRSMVLVLNSVLFFYYNTSIFSIMCPTSPLVIFAKRLYHNLVRIFNYLPKAIMPKNMSLLYDVLKRYPTIQTKFGIEFLAPSIFLQGEKFIDLIKSKINVILEDGVYKNVNSYNLYCISEGLKFFFKVPFSYGGRHEFFDKMLDQVKKLGFQLSCKVFESVEFVDENAYETINEILSGTYDAGKSFLQYYIGRPIVDTLLYFGDKSGVPENGALDEISIQQMLNLKKGDLKGWLPPNLRPIRKTKEIASNNNALKTESNVNISATSELAIAILCNIVDFFKTATVLFETDVLAPNKKTNMKFLEQTLLIGLLSSRKKLVKETLSTMQVFLMFLKVNPDDDRFSTLYTLNGYTCLLLSLGAFNLGAPDSTRILVLKVLEKYLKLRNTLNQTLYAKNQFKEIDSEDEMIFNQLHESLGRTCYLSICFHDVNVHNTIRGLYGLYQKEIEHYSKFVGKSVEELGICNYEFANSISTCTTVYGPIAFQRHIRADILKLINIPNRKMFDTLTLFYEQWFQMSIIGYENLSNHDQNKYRNFSGMLAASSGVFNFRNNIFLSLFPYLKMSKNLITQKVDFFIRRQSELLDSSDLLSRENCKDILSMELNSVYFDYLFENLRKKLDFVIIVDSDNNVIENFILLEQIILVMRSLMEREDIKVIILTTSEILNIVKKILNLINRLRPESTNHFKAMIHMSKLFLSFKHSERFLFIRGDHNLKNSWMKILINWFSLAIFKEMDYENLTKPHREMDLARRDIDYLYLDTSIECAKALAYLTSKIVLESPQAASEEELRRSRSALFGNYFNVLLKALEKTADYENIPFVLRHKVLIFNENVILCLTNLLNANANIGLDYALPIGYSSNRMIRLTFLKVFVEITKNINLNTSELNKNQEEKVNKILQNMITYPKLLCLIASACPVNDIESLSTSLVSIFNSKNINHILISYLVVDEIENSTRCMDILRRNSIATRTLAMFSRMYGHDYLQNIIKPVLDAIIENDEDFEIEKPSSTPELAEQNLARFEKYLVMLIDRICSSINEIPEEFIYISQKIHEATEKKFPISELIAVGSFIFLRFFCPALVSPDTENLISSLSTKNRRTFILLARVVQNIANQTVSSLKWPLLQDKKSLLDECSNKIVQFLGEVSDLNRETHIKVNPSAPILRQQNLGAFHKILYNHKMEIREGMIETVNDEVSLDKLIEISKVIDDALLCLGQPAMEFKDEIPQFIKDDVEKYAPIYELLNRYVLKQQNISKDISFAHEAIDTEGNPMIVFSLKHISDESYGVDQIIYKLLLLSSRIWYKKHTTLFDGTGCTSVNYERLRNIFSLYSNLIPLDTWTNHTKTIIYNFNEGSMKLFREMEKYIIKDIYSIPPAHEFINSDCSPEVMNSLKLSKYSIDVYNDVRVTLHNTLLYEPSKKRFIPVTLKIGNKTFQVLRETPNRFKFQGLEDVYEVFYNNVYDIKRIVSASLSSTTGIPFEFTIQLEGGNTLIMSTQKYQEILKIFYYAQAKLDDDYREGSFQDQNKPMALNKNMNSQLDMLAHTMFVIFTGLSSCDDEIKSTSYSLLAVVQESFELNFGQKLHNLPEVYMPDDNDIFTQVIFENLAHTKPELTYYIWKHFLDGINKILLDDQMVHCINCLSPWISNIYEYVYAADNVQGAEKASSIIRSLIKVSVKKKRFSETFKYFIWSDLILDSSLLTLMIDEIINHAIDRESEGSDWKSCVSILTRISTVEILGQIIQRLLKLINTFIPSLGNDQNINSWSEIYILISIVQDLSFNTSMNFEMCLPEILLIVSMLIDMGPSKLRRSLHRLLVNVCNAFVGNNVEGSENMKQLMNVIEPLTSQKAKQMFGFNQETNFVHYYTNVSTLLSKVGSLGQLVDYIVCIMRYGSPNTSYADQWQAKYNELIMETIFGNSSFLSSRAMMIFSLVSREGVSKDLICKLLAVTMRIMGSPEVSQEIMMYLVTHIVSYGNFIQGTTDIEIIAKILWFSSTLLCSPNVALFHSGLLTFLASFKRLHALCEDKEFTTTLLWENDRHGQEQILSSLEALSGLRCTRSNLIHLIIYAIAKGALVSHTKVTAIQGFKTFFKIAQRTSNLQGTKYDMGFLLFLYISLPTAEFGSFFKSFDLPSETVQLDETCTAPKVLVDWLLSDDETKNIILYQASIYTSDENFEDINKLKVFSLAIYIAKNKPEVFFRYMKRTILDARKTEQQGVLLELLRKSFDISNIAIMDERYQYISRYEKELEQRIAEMNLIGIKRMSFPSNTGHIMSGILEDTTVVYDRKRYTVMLLDSIINTC